MIKLFNSNENNIGGRSDLNNLVYNHHLHLLQIKPTIKLSNNSNNYNKKKKKDELAILFKEKTQFNEVYHSFKKVCNIKKGYINNSAPKTMQLKVNLQNKSRKNERFINELHDNNRISQINRIKRRELKIERKKNEFDPVAHPVLEFTYLKKKKPEGSLNLMFNPLLNRQKILKVKNLKEKSHS